VWLELSFHSHGFEKAAREIQACLQIKQNANCYTQEIQMQKLAHKQN
jgi:hypothetical protein